MKVLPRIIALTLSLPLLACATPSLFPPEVTSDLTPGIEFGVLQAQPDVFRGRAIELAGRIIEVQETEKGTLIIATQLPVLNHPAYGPAETATPTGQFALLFPGKVDQAGLWDGNKFIVVGKLEGAKAVSYEGVPRSEPFLVARCMHVWKTGRYYEISDFPHIADGYWPLEEQTYCAK